MEIIQSQREKNPLAIANITRFFVINPAGFDEEFLN